MIVVDTSVWIDRLRGGERSIGLGPIVEEDRVLLHPWVLGELALGNLGRRRKQILDDLRVVTPAPVLSEDDVHAFIEAGEIAGAGIGWVDVNVLGSALVAEASVWTLDRRLRQVAERCGVRVL